VDPSFPHTGHIEGKEHTPTMTSVARFALSVVVGLGVVIALAVTLFGGLSGAPVGAPPVPVASPSPSPADRGESLLPGAASPARSPAATPTVESSPTSPATATATLTPASTPTLAPASTPTPSPVPVTEAEANGVVKDFFAALDQDDYERAASKGSGQGEQQIRAMVSAIEKSARERGIQLDLEISNLTIDATAERGAGRLVNAGFSAVAFARVGQFRLPVSTANGSAVFLVERVAGEPLITEVSSVEGLPGA
jgi:hypothetical protein